MTPRSTRGSAYVEYFLAAAAMFTAAMWLYQGGNLRGLKGHYESVFDGWMDQMDGV